jgi:hypothetical protein
MVEVTFRMKLPGHLARTSTCLILSAYKPNGIGDDGGFLVCGENDLWKGRRPYGRRVHFDLDRRHRSAVDLA